MLSSSLHVILQSEIKSVRALGGNEGEDRLMHRLTETQAHALRIYYLAATMVVVLFIVMLGLLLSFGNSPTILVSIGSLCGTGIAGLILILLKVSREISQSGLLLALVSKLPQDDVLPALQAIVNYSTSKAKE